MQHDRAYYMTDEITAYVYIYYLIKNNFFIFFDKNCFNENKIYPNIFS